MLRFAASALDQHRGGLERASKTPTGGNRRFLKGPRSRVGRLHELRPGKSRPFGQVEPPRSVASRSHCKETADRTGRGTEWACRLARQPKGGF